MKNKMILCVSDAVSFLASLACALLFVTGGSELCLYFSLAFALVFIGCLIMTVKADRFTAYEKIWFLSILCLASVFCVLFPEEEINGVHGAVLMIFYLLDTLLNILCELLISKQSKWNFIVSLAVEVTEIAISLLLVERFATMAVTFFFWIPIDIISFISWSRHPDADVTEITEVKKLSGVQLVLGIGLIVVWTVGVGYLTALLSDKLALLDIESKLADAATLEKIVCYVDAAASAVGIANGVFILLRYREQWIAWYICCALELVTNVLMGLWVLIPLKIGYLTNTTYGYIKWTRYIKSKQSDS